MTATTTTEKSYRAVIIMEGGKIGYHYNAVRETFDEAFEDKGRIHGELLTQNLPYQTEVVVQETVTTTTVLDELTSAVVILTGIVER